MTILQLIISLIVIGVILYIVNTVIPMDGRIKTILNAVVIIAVCLWVLGMFALPGSFWNRRIG